MKWHLWNHCKGYSLKIFSCGLITTYNNTYNNMYNNYV